jgi:hypothetical protein
VEPIMPEPGRRGWADLLTLVGAVRRLAFDHTLAAVGGAGQDQGTRSPTTTPAADLGPDGGPPLLQGAGRRRLRGVWRFVASYSPGSAGRIM